MDKEKQKFRIVAFLVRIKSKLCFLLVIIKTGVHRDCRCMRGRKRAEKAEKQEIQEEEKNNRQSAREIKKAQGPPRSDRQRSRLFHMYCRWILSVGSHMCSVEFPYEPEI